MQRSRQIRLTIFFGVIASLGLAIPPFAAAQGCALCYQSAAAAGSRAIHALRNGIAILMIPPVFICTGISYLAYRRRNLHNDNS
ncbi:MAG TPA: hypothetical protein VGI46_19265 [Candidatus Acidoferrum sp.]|jgi:hypothetical protein